MGGEDKFVTKKPIGMVKSSPAGRGVPRVFQENYNGEKLLSRVKISWIFFHSVWGGNPGSKDPKNRKMDRDGNQAKARIDMTVRIKFITSSLPG